jgi:hypothetical protein
MLLGFVLLHGCSKYKRMQKKRNNYFKDHFETLVTVSVSNDYRERERIHCFYFLFFKFFSEYLLKC